MKIFGWFIYASREKLRFRLDYVQNRGNLSARLKGLRNRRYKKLKGCCETCGRPGEKEQFQLHHILPYATFPELAKKDWNLVMLCPCCHYFIHNNPLWQSQMMQRVAREHGINLEQVYRRSLSQRWSVIQAERKGGAV